PSPKFASLFPTAGLFFIASKATAVPSIFAMPQIQRPGGLLLTQIAQAQFLISRALLQKTGDP
ncbi:MAG: hypothetical protein ACKOF3_01235, partial [Spartobacteria bacterium]